MPLCSAETVTSVASKVPVASYPFSLFPQLASKASIAAIVIVFFISVIFVKSESEKLIVGSEFQIVNLLQHLYLMNSLLYFCTVLGVDFLHEVVHVDDAMGEFRFCRFAYC